MILSRYLSSVSLRLEDHVKHSTDRTKVSLPIEAELRVHFKPASLGSYNIRVFYQFSLKFETEMSEVGDSSRDHDTEIWSAILETNNLLLEGLTGNGEEDSLIICPSIT